MIPWQNPDLGLGLNPHLLNDLATLPQQTPHISPWHHHPRRHPPLSTPPVIILTITPTAATLKPKIRIALKNPLMDHQKRILRRRKFRRAPVSVSPAHIGDLDDPLIVAVDERVNINPRPGLLPDGLDDAPGLSDHPSGLIIRAEDAEEHGLRGRRRGFLVGFGRPAAGAAPPLVAVAVVVVSRFAPRRSLRIVVLIVVVAPSRSRSLHCPSI